MIAYLYLECLLYSKHNLNHSIWIKISLETISRLKTSKASSNIFPIIYCNRKVAYILGRASQALLTGRNVVWTLNLIKPYIPLNGPFLGLIAYIFEEGVIVNINDRKVIINHVEVEL